jgi:geranylgeranyl diphosphate synthase type I
MQSSSSPETTALAGGGLAVLLDRYRHRFDAELAAWLDAKRRAVAAETPEAAELVAAVARLATAGGKRLRPALVAFTAAACGGDGTGVDGAAGRLALASELLHTYLLIHDDIMDHAEQRRGRPAAHAAFAERHREAGLAGDGEDFGVTAAILAGDLAHAWAHELVADAVAALPEVRRRRVAAAFAATAQEVIGGQYLEILLSQRRTGSADELARALRLKSGRYSVERPIQLGALAAGADGPTVDALSIYGSALGEAFQLQDDVLGTFGDPGEVGKPTASDLEEGKFTFLVFHALEALPAGDAERLRSALGRRPLPQAELAELRELLVTSGALAKVQAMIAERLATARAAYSGLEARLAGDGRAFLAGLIDYVAERRR